MARQLEWWFRGGADEEIRRRFSSLHERAVRGELDRWADASRSRLALILVLDQLARSLHRGTPGAYAEDAKARALALDGIERGHYAALASPWEKTFFSMPLGHSEEIAHLDRAVALAEELARRAPESIRKLLEHSASQARGHRDVVAKFGRQPHRNAILGRPSTPEEIVYLERGEFVHLRAVPRARTIVPIELDDPRHCADFVRLNELWITEHFALEEADRALAADPMKIVRDGGHILARVEGGRVVGVCALFKESEDRYQLARMAVEPAERGKGYGDDLVAAALAKAKQKGARSVYLLSNTVLAPALALYRKHGFRTVSEGCHPVYARCDVVMERSLE